VTGGVLKIARRIGEVGVAGSSLIGRRQGDVLDITAAAVFWQQKANAKC